MRSKIVVALIAFSLALPAVAYAAEFSVGLSVGKLDPSGKVQSGALGDKISLTNVLGIGDDSPVGVNLRVDGEKHHFSFDHTAIEFDGSKTYPVLFTFQGKNYTANLATKSKLQFRLSELTYYYDLWEAETGPESEFSFSPLIKLSIYDTEVSVEMKTAVPPIDESFSESLPIPTIGFVLGYKFNEYVRASGQLSTIGYSGSTFTNYEIVVGVRPIEYFNIDIGYRGTKMGFDEGDDELDFEMNGLYGQVSYVHAF